MAHKKHLLEMTVVDNTPMGSTYSLIKLAMPDRSALPPMDPGQFVQIEVADSKTTYLRRPISINFVDTSDNTLWLLIRKAGDGTRKLCASKVGERISVVLPLGRGFSMPAEGSKVLLVGGGVGVAPLLYLGYSMKQRGIRPQFLLGARSEADLLMINEFRAIGDVALSTDDGSAGEKGVVTTNSIFERKFDIIYCCGPMPMMKAVAALAAKSKTPCEVSLENKMACGIGACLCCVEKNSNGHNVCVCTDGPVFNSNDLSW